MYTYDIDLQQKSLFWLGDRFFKVEQEASRYSRGGQVEYRSKCPSCDDTRKVKYKGCDGNEYEAKCPVCEGSVGIGYGNCITLNNWEVHEYFVYKINAQGPTNVSAYKDGIGYVDSVSLTAFHKYGRCMDDYIETHVPCVENVIDPDLERLIMAEVEQYERTKGYVFRSKKDAEKLCAMLKEYDRERLKKFNETYGTAHDYPY